MKLLNPKIRQKFAESLKAVLPVVGIVIVLSFTIAPITSSILLCFLVGALMVMVGMMFFTLGAEMSMTPMGEKVGARMTQSKNILLIVVLSFLLGAGQCEIKLIIRIGEQIVDRYYRKKGAGNAVAVAHRPSGDDHQCKNVEQCYIGMVVRYYMLI